MKPVSQPDRFQALDACHQQIHIHLGKLTDVLQKIEAGAEDAQYRQQAGEIEAFFSGTSHQHHTEEEKNVFPGLLASSDPELVQAVRTLQQDHGWMERNWLELAPMLRAIAEGEDWIYTSELQHGIEVFLKLCHDHIVLEEMLIYPAAKGLLAQELASRIKPLK